MAANRDDATVWGAFAYAGVGAFVAILLFAVQVPIGLYLPPSSPLKRVVLWLNWLPTAFLECCAQLFKNGNTDQMLGPWLWVFPLYWILLGSLCGIACHRLRRRKHRTLKERHEC